MDSSPQAKHPQWVRTSVCGVDSNCSTLSGSEPAFVEWTPIAAPSVGGGRDGCRLNSRTRSTASGFRRSRPCLSIEFKNMISRFGPLTIEAVRTFAICNFLFDFAN